MVKNVLVLCLGNINRSPLCAAILERHGIPVRQAALKALTNEAWRPERAARKTRDAALELGLNLEEHRSRRLEPEDLDWADIVVIMDNSNETRLGQALTNWGKFAVVRRLGHFASPPVDSIKDPAFIPRGTQEFHDVILQIRAASLNLAKKLIAGEV